MDEDQAEMQAFSGRLKDRDDSKTKKSMLDEDKTGERLKELAQLKQDEREDHLKSLRVRSREDYLVKRTSQKLVELEADLKDEAYLYEGVKLTKKERCDFASLFAPFLRTFPSWFAQPPYFPLLVLTA